MKMTLLLFHVVLMALEFLSISQCYTFFPEKNCSREIEICVPSLKSTCEKIAIPTKRTVLIPYTYVVQKAVCVETVEVVATVKDKTWFDIRKKYSICIFVNYFRCFYKLKKFEM